MNGKTLTQDTTYLSFLDDLARLSEATVRVREKLVLLAPTKEGSYLRLVQETSHAMRESKEGKGKMFSTAEEAVKDLESLTHAYADKKAAQVSF